MSDLPDIATTDQLAEHLQVSIETILRAVRVGNLVPLRIGRQYRYQRDDVRAWLNTLRIIKPEAQ